MVIIKRKVHGFNADSFIGGLFTPYLFLSMQSTQEVPPLHPSGVKIQTFRIFVHFFLLFFFSIVNFDLFSDTE